MSELSMYEYEFGDIAWDEFCQSDDHIVPHPSGIKACKNSFLGECFKKPRREAVGIVDNLEDWSACRNVCEEKVQENLQVMNNKRKSMLEKDSWLQTPNGVCPSPCGDLVKEVSNLASDGTRTSTLCFKSNSMDSIGSEFCASDAILSGKSAAVDNNSYSYPLGHISQTDNDLSFFDSNRDDKDSGDFLYYGWPDIGNFEDVDRIFRSCDSTFGLGTSNEDELGWFSPSDAVEGSGDVLKSEFRFSCPDSTTVGNNTQNCEALRTNDSSVKTTSVSYEDSSWLSDNDKHDILGHLSYVNGTSSSDSKGDSVPIEQGVEYPSDVQHKIPTTNNSTNCGSRMVNAHKKQPKQQNQSDAKRKDQCLADGGSFYYNNNLQNEDSKLPSQATSSQALSSMGIQQQKHALGPESFGCLHSNIPYIHSDYSHPSDQTSVYPTLSAPRSDNNGFTSVSPKESYSSNQVLSAESSHGSSFLLNPVVSNDKRENLQQQNVFQSSFNTKSESMDIGAQVPLCNAVFVEKKARHLGHRFENCGDAEPVPGELGSATVQESSSVSSVLNEISLEAASFQQLQLVMEQLDLRTKLCIRDSLYRLARSAEQRHNQENMSGSCCEDDKDTSGVLVSEGGNKCSGFMDMETDTNPIDRSIAHLLFHRPSVSSAIPAQDSLSYKTPTVMDGSTSISPAMAEKLVKDETSAAETVAKVADP